MKKSRAKKVDSAPKKSRAKKSKTIPVVDLEVVNESKSRRVEVTKESAKTDGEVVTKKVSTVAKK